MWINSRAGLSRVVANAHTNMLTASVHHKELEKTAALVSEHERSDVVLASEPRGHSSSLSYEGDELPPGISSQSLAASCELFDR